jgi:hypothetical protein
MRKYTDAPKEIPNAIQDAIPISREEGLGGEWKKLHYGDDLPTRRSVPLRSVAFRYPTK